MTSIQSILSTLYPVLLTGIVQRLIQLARITAGVSDGRVLLTWTGNVVKAGWLESKPGGKKPSSPQSAVQGNLSVVGKLEQNGTNALGGRLG